MAKRDTMIYLVHRGKDVKQHSSRMGAIFWWMRLGHLYGWHKVWLEVINEQAAAR